MPETLKPPQNFSILKYFIDAQKFVAKIFGLKKIGSMNYTASESRYDSMKYNYAGKSGLKLPAIQLGMWYNFGLDPDFENCKNMIFTAFDCGITMFDMANNYCNSTAEITAGKIFKDHLSKYRDEILITSKAGYKDIEGPYGEWGSKKSVIASLDRSLRKSGLDYFDVFYSHRFDPNTPLEETINALCDAVKQGKILYLAVSNYDGKSAQKAYEIAKSRSVPLIANQVRYNIFDRRCEQNGAQDSDDLSLVCYSPLEQGLLSSKYINGIPADSRAGREPANPWLNKNTILPRVEAVKKMCQIAESRGQSLSQMAIRWLLQRKRVASVLIGASKPEQIKDCAKAVQSAEIDACDMQKIDDASQGLFIEKM